MNIYTLTDKKKERLVTIIKWVEQNRNLLDNDTEILKTLHIIFARGFYKDRGKELLNRLESYIK